MIEIVWKLDVWLRKFCFPFYLFIFPSSLYKQKYRTKTKRREQDEKEFAVWVNLSAGGRQ